MERLYFIVNPAAGAGRCRERFAQARAKLEAQGILCEAVYTERRGHAAQLARQAVAQGETRIVAVGGDGTLNEVAPALVHTNAALGILPFGTGNDLIRPLGIPRDADGALRVLLAGAPRPMDVGLANDRCFFNVAGFGFDVEVLRATARYAGRFGGMLPYLLGIAEALSRLRPMRLVIHANGEVIEQESLLIAVGNGTHFGGGMMAVPEADPFDGLFDVCVAKKLSVLRFLLLLPSFVKGRHAHRKEVLYFRARELYVECDRPSLINLDGELDLNVPVRFQLLPGALKILM